MKAMNVRTGEIVKLDPRQKTGVDHFIRVLLPKNKYDPRTCRRPKEAAKAARRAACQTT